VWSLLHRNQESVLVGTAVTLVMLALLAHGRATMDTNEGLQVAGSLAKSPGYRPAILPSVPSDPAFYAAKWRQIATDFYALNPVKDAQGMAAPTPASSTADVVTASLTDHADATEINHPQDNGGNPIAVTPVSHSKPILPFEPIPNLKPQTLVGDMVPLNRGPVVGKPALAAAFSAGLLAFLCFRSLWPNVIPFKPSFAMSVSTDQSDPSTLIRMELPHHWVRIRPPLRQRIKPVVLATSYVAGGFAAWMIVS